jgi:hypothetical protein
MLEYPNQHVYTYRTRDTNRNKSIDGLTPTYVLYNSFYEAHTRTIMGIVPHLSTFIAPYTYQHCIHLILCFGNIRSIFSK